MRKASRLFEIIQILRLARQPVTAAMIAAQLEVTVRSIYRDIAALQAMRVPIEGGRGIGYILRPGFDLPPLMFSIEEMEAIVLSLALLERTGDSELKQAAKRVSAKIAGAVPPPLRQAFDANALHVSGFAAPAFGTIDLALVRRAIRDEEKLDLSYRDEMGRALRAPDPPHRTDLLRRDRQPRGLVRTPPSDPQFPQRLHRGLPADRATLQGRR